MIVRFRIFFALSLLMFALMFNRGATAHEFWIEAEEYQLAPGVPVKARLFNGESFTGVELAWFERRIAAASWALGARATAFEGRAGDRPALQLDGMESGLLRLIYQSRPSEVSYTDWAKFESFVTGKGAAWVLARHKARGLGETRIRESYTRFCKALLSVGSGAGADAYSGMEFELVALGNPYVAVPETGLAVQVLYKGKPHGAAQLEVFQRGPDGTVMQSKLKADGSGIVHVPVAVGHRYLLNAVLLREHDAPDVPWESLWASMTFEVPG